jgi:hypothetical protein
MSNDPEAPAEAERPRLGEASTLARFTLTSIALATVVGTFASSGGWFTRNELTPVGAMLFHTLIVRDSFLTRMVPWNSRPQEAASTE